jgi:hypothetical protein
MPIAPTENAPASRAPTDELKLFTAADARFITEKNRLPSIDNSPFTLNANRFPFLDGHQSQPALTLRMLEEIRQRF